MSDWFEMITEVSKDVAQANKRIEVFDHDGIYMHSIYPEDRHDSDAEEFRREQKDLRSFFDVQR